MLLWGGGGGGGRLGIRAASQRVELLSYVDVAVAINRHLIDGAVFTWWDEFERRKFGSP